MAIFAVIDPTVAAVTLFNEMYGGTAFTLGNVDGHDYFTCSGFVNLSGDVLHSFPSTSRVIWQGYIRTSDITSMVLLSYREATTNHINVWLNASSFLELRRGTVVLVTSTTALSADTWYYIQIDVTVNDTTGACIIKVDGVEVMNSTGLDTSRGLTSIIETLVFTNSAGSVLYGPCFFADGAGSDFNSLSTAILEVGTIFPNAAGNSADWTPSIGNNHQTVDETPVDQADYNESSVNLDKDTFNLGSITALSIACVVPFAIAEMTAADAASLNTIARHSTSEAAGPDILIVQDLVRMFQSFAHVNPSTGLAWTPTEVNAAESGYELSV